MREVASLIATLALGFAAWWVTRGATHYLVVNLAGALALWVLLVFTAAILSAGLLKVMDGGKK